ncbi:hypothetical protein [Oribacterium parvum]|uniref:hypothetical protein n=1 Tax=Oribacterium parvum TaxID=1501329 RepID=UPI0028E51D8F|nr:hypothetical protein [Oribacterium parvum]
MRIKSFLLILFLISISLQACKSKEPLQYKVNKTPELQQYESELAEKAEFQESLAKEKKPRKKRKQRKR